MGRVLIKTQAWGVQFKTSGGFGDRVHTWQGLACSLSVPVYAASTGSTTVSSFSTNDSGELPGYVDEGGPYTLTRPDASTVEVHAVHGEANRPEFLVEKYRNISTTDKAAAEGAMTAASASTRGGIVKFGPGAYALADWAPVLPSSLTQCIDIRGAGKLQTTLTFSTDTGAGHWAIRASGDAASGEVCYSQISDAWIIGPSTTTTLGAIPSNMYGIRQTRRMRLERLVISGFGVGVQIAGDHTTMRDVDCAQNYAGVFFAQMAALFGDNLLENCDLTGNTFASIAIANNALASINMIGGHLGFSPYCIYGEAGASAALQMGGCTFTRTSWEAAGNGWIYSADKSMRIDGLTMTDCGMTRSATYDYTSNPTDYGIYVAEFYRVKMNGTVMRDAWDAGQINAVNVRGFDMDRATSSWDAAVAAGVPFMFATGGTAVGCRLQTDTWKARGAIANATLSRGQLVGRNTLFMYSYGGGSVTLEGVALNDASAANLRVCWACYEGEDIYTLTKAAITATHSLVVDATDRSKVSGEANTGAALTRQYVGYPYSGTGGVDSNIQAFVRI